MAKSKVRVDKFQTKPEDIIWVKKPSKSKIKLKGFFDAIKRIKKNNS